MRGVRSCMQFINGERGSRASTIRTYGEIVHYEAVEEVDVGISEVAQIDILLNWRLLGLQLFETWQQ
jgi:hypothetical protein